MTKPKPRASGRSPLVPSKFFYANLALTLPDQLRDHFVSVVNRTQATPLDAAQIAKAMASRAGRIA